MRESDTIERERVVTTRDVAATAACSLAAFLLIVLSAFAIAKSSAFQWLPPTQGTHESTIKVAAIADYAPYSYLDGNGNAAGFDVELAYAIGEELGSNVQIELGDWVDIKAGVERGDYDLLMGVTLSETRRETMELSTAYVNDLFGAFGESIGNRAANLAKSNIAVLRGGYESDVAVLANFMEGVTQDNVIPYDSYLEEMEAVRSGECSYAVVPERFGDAYVIENGMKGIAPQGLPIYMSVYCIGTAKGNAALIDKVNDAINEIDARGDLAAMNKHWFENDAARLTLAGFALKHALSFGLLLVAIFTVGFAFLWLNARRKAAEQRQAQLLSELNRTYADYAAAFRFNLSKNRNVTRSSPYEHILRKVRSDTVDGCFQLFSKLVDDEALRQWVVDNLTCEKLLERFAEGETTFSFDYPIIFQDGTRHWQEGTFHLLKSPVSGDIEAIVFSTSIDERKRDERITQLLASDELDFVALVSPKDHAYVLLNRGSFETVIAHGEKVSYETATETLLEHHVLPENRAVTREAIRFDNLLKTIDETGIYSISYLSGDEAAPAHKQIRARWLDARGGDILITQRDITYAYERDREAMKREMLLDLYEHDQVTGLLSRDAALIRTDRNLTREDEFTMVVLVLDNLQLVYDAFGHVCGDVVLKKAASMVRRYASAGNAYVTAHMGSGRFLMCLKGCMAADEAEKELRALENMVRRPIELGVDTEDIELDETIWLHTSIGTAASDGISIPEEIIRMASLAAEAVQKVGGGIKFYSGDLAASIARRNYVRNILAQAIEDDRLYMLYQPKVDLRTGRVCGFEALARIKDGDIAPTEFIAVAEEAGLIRDVGRITTRLVVEQIAAWRVEGRELLPVSVNYSSRQMSDVGYLSYLAELLEGNDVPSSLVEIEITESLLVRPGKAAQALFDGFGALGVRILMDDFGSGYSSLSYLAFMPVDTVKLDKSIIDAYLIENDDENSAHPDNVNGNAFVHDLIRFTHDLGKKIIVEGVEEAWQAELLSGFGCDAIQGFYYARPLPPDAAMRFITSR